MKQRSDTIILVFCIEYTVATVEVTWRAKIRSRAAIQEAKDGKRLSQTHYIGRKIRERNEKTCKNYRN